MEWSGPSGVVSYSWDGAGNRLSAGTDAYTYDERNRILSGPDGSYSYAARGSLDEIVTGTGVVDYDFDALGRLVSYDGSVGYTYDGLDRVAARNTDVFVYGDGGFDPVSDGVFTYGRSPGGRLVSQTDGTTPLLAGLGRHGDLNFLFDASGVVSDTRVFDPFGDAVASTGSTGQALGFQSDYTDPASDHVWMGTRWYDGGWAAFLSRDTVFGELRTPISLNRYTYGFANPLGFWDPDGRLGFDTFNSIEAAASVGNFDPAPDPVAGGTASASHISNMSAPNLLVEATSGSVPQQNLYLEDFGSLLAAPATATELTAESQQVTAGRGSAADVGLGVVAEADRFVSDATDPVTLSLHQGKQRIRITYEDGSSVFVYKAQNPEMYQDLMMVAERAGNPKMTGGVSAFVTSEAGELLDMTNISTTTRLARGAGALGVVGDGLEVGVVVIGVHEQLAEGNTDAALEVAGRGATGYALGGVGAAAGAAVCSPYVVAAALCGLVVGVVVPYYGTTPVFDGFEWFGYNVVGGVPDFDGGEVFGEGGSSVRFAP